MDRSALLKEFGFIAEEEGKKEEETEVLDAQYTKTGFPQPIQSFRLSWEVYDLSLEEPYFWILDVLKESFPVIEKLEDAFAAAENSAFFGVSQQRLAAQQDRVSQFLATAGKMIKELFQMVRELRILDERLTYYEEAAAELPKPIAERKKSAEITLKGIFIDLVQGGGKSPGSVYGMARELEFITLPDLFFDTPPFRGEPELDAYVKNLDETFNRNLVRVLQRHLRQFIEWKLRTHKEHATRKRFMLKYLKQHFEIIKMYITWVKPYLSHVGKLTLKEKSLESADLVAAFEGSMLDIEILARKEEKVDDENTVNSCLLVSFAYRTRPELKVQQEGYQRGPVHIGKMEVNFRAYVWMNKEVENYRALKDKETKELMGEVSSSIREAMTSLGTELDQYLEEAQELVRAEKEQKGEKKEEKSEEKKEPKKTFAEKFLGEFYVPRKKGEKKQKTSKELLQKIEEKKKELRGHVLNFCWIAYHNFKKSHRMIAW